MKKDTMQLLVSLLACVLFSVILVSWLRFIIARDKLLFREELIWYEKYQIVREMTLNGIPENVIADHLTTQIQLSWNQNEIIRMIEIAQSY